MSIYHRKQMVLITGKVGWWTWSRMMLRAAGSFEVCQVAKMSLIPWKGNVYLYLVISEITKHRTHARKIKFVNVRVAWFKNGAMGSCFVQAPSIEPLIIVWGVPSWIRVWVHGPLLKTVSSVIPSPSAMATRGWQTSRGDETKQQEQRRRLWSCSETEGHEFGC